MKQDKQKKIRERLEIMALLREQKVLNHAEAAIYLGISEGWLHRATCKRLIPHSKPNGKNNYYDRELLDKWLLRNRRATAQEVEAAAK